MGMIIHGDGRQEWYENGRLHRLDGPARIWADGSQGWYVDDRLHRLDGPAVIHADGSQEWYVDGELHRVDGPARIWADGSQEWFVCGNNITRQVITWMQQRNVTWPWDQETQMEFVLTWA